MVIDADAAPFIFSHIPLRVGNQAAFAVAIHFWLHNS